jgi:CelD/BcsL family acetyltransferase involved in cellulose biosynthesis
MHTAAAEYMSFAPPSGVATRKYTVELVERWQDLESQVAAWDDLADTAVEANHFFSSGAVIAAMRHLQPEGKPAFLIVRGSDPSAPLGAPVWCGFFPFFRHRSYRGLPIRNLRLLKHDYCFLRVPLIRTGCVADVLAQVLDWLDASDCALVELADQTGAGDYAEALAAAFRQRRMSAQASSSHARAFIERGDSADAYLRAAISGGKLKELRRQQRRLGEKGELKVESLAPTGDVESAIVEFLALERAGWKGAAGTAMSCRPRDREFFTELLRRAFRRGRLQMITLRLDGQPIAMKCNLLAPPGAFAFKIAYAEGLAQYSPGVLLELENIRRLHDEAHVQWMDSCAVPGHPMIEHLWKQHRLIQSWVIPLGTWGHVATSTLALAQWIVRRRTQPVAP